MNSTLRVDFCSREAAEYAVQRWHYSRSLPAGKMVTAGAWESGQFKGAVIFSLGSNRHIGRPYGLSQQEVCELTRVALGEHKAPVSRIVRFSLKLLRRHCPGLRLVVSYADTNQGHHGGIYQAGNWIYEGECANEQGVMLRGKLTHRRSINARYGTSALDWLRENIDPRVRVVEGTPKHKYLMPLDKPMRRAIEKLRKPYPRAAARGGAVTGQATAAVRYRPGRSRVSG